jgi:hypothetical protein
MLQRTKLQQSEKERFSFERRVDSNTWVFATVVVLAAIVTFGICYHNQSYIDAGYHLEYDEKRDTTHWTKPERFNKNLIGPRPLVAPR